MEARWTSRRLRRKQRCPDCHRHWRPSEVFSVRRKLAGINLPFPRGEPGSLLCCDIEKAGILIAISGVRCNQHGLPSGEISVAAKFFSPLCRVRLVAGPPFPANKKYVCILAGRVLLGEDDPFTVPRPDGIEVAQIRRRCCWSECVTFLVRISITSIFVIWRLFGFHHVSQLFSVRGPCGAFFRDLRRVAQVHDLSVCW